jgi:hypothetical protein
MPEVSDFLVFCYLPGHHFFVPTILALHPAVSWRLQYAVQLFINPGGTPDNSVLGMFQLRSDLHLLYA